MTAPAPRTVAVRRLRATLRAVVRAVQEEGEPVVLTRHGRPVAALVPVDAAGICSPPALSFPAGSPLSARLPPTRARPPPRPRRLRMVARSDIGRVRLETRRVADLVPAAYNPRRDLDKALAGLGESIGRYGLVQPIIVNARTGHVVGGHQRLKVLEARGVEATDVVVVDVAEAEEKALNLGAQLPADLGRVDRGRAGLLEEVVGALPDLGEALRLPDLARRSARSSPRRWPATSSRTRSPSRRTRPSRSPATSGHPRGPPALCGDSGREADLDRLLDGERRSTSSTPTRRTT